mmetsp:Transcript_53580/g.105665  ORF Transcript_53580/g.105665 Transcript_53580/m.105665 type:complete len:268 (+) Transcript_53580:61-864(+)|eukprot:CAMPEP_0170393752 /NCGR_PEP_ID=MMETSP0117_2-20130122/20892_1 /TAXON_ID=400756 /ORGANISM="Durinskia baltica, Strain CSIRO CS-38" /LENGTH=267 /DNA_ID=CAMNT_0010649975 /DNA_START=62 /DNA_END=868 /DNA_ORIENTATION=-
MNTLLFIAAVLCCICAFTSEAAVKEMEKKSVLLLDGITFPKIVPNPNRDVIVLVSLKSQFGDYGTDSMRSDYFNFAFRSQTEGDSDHVIFSQVIVNGGENKALATSIGVSDDFKHPQMFIYPAGASTPIEYPTDEPFHLDRLTQFAARHSSLQFQLPGTLKKFDEIAAEFMRAEPSRQAGLLQQAEEEAEGLVEAGQSETAAYYIKVMRRILDNGFEFISKEIKRQTRIANDASKLTKAGRRNIENHLNVLNHFKALIPTVTVRDEF